jgi:hypothetical protein
MQTNKTHLPSLLILMTLGLSVALLLALATIMGIASLLDLINDRANPATEMINAVVFGFEALLVAACAWFVLQKMLKRDQADPPIHFPFSGAYVFAVFAVVIPALIVGGLVASREIPFLSWVVLPLLTVIVIALPVWLLLGIGGRGVELGARWRFFGVLGLGLTLSPFVMIVLELIVLVIVLIVALAFVAVQPGSVNELLNLSALVQAQTNEDMILQLLAPYLVKPGVVVTMLVYVAVFVPLIEEACKPLAVWLFAKSVETPAQGYVLGLLSGAAFGLIESLNAGADGSASWALVVSVRAGTTLLHIAASGLVGWGVVSMFQQKKILRFIAAYLSAAAIHGLWNACALVAGLSSIGYVTGGASASIFAAVPAALGGMFTLGIGMFILLVTSNRKLRSASNA